MNKLDGDTPGPITLRRARPDDTETVTQIFLAARRQMHYLPRLHTDAETGWWIDNIVLAENEVWAAEVSGRVVGFAAREGDWLRHLYVAPQAQGRDVGTTLLDQVKHKAPQTLWLRVFQANIGAQRFYRRHGFTLAELGDGTENEEGVPDALYRWTPRL